MSIRLVWRLDRLGRSLKNVLEIMGSLEERGIEFQSLTESLDTSNPSRKLIFYLFARVAEFERAFTRERTRAGLAAARARGRKGGRPCGKAFNTPQKIATAEALYYQGAPMKEICELLHCSSSTLYRSIETKKTNQGKQGGSWFSSAYIRA